jgi:hypothetical protein
MLDLTLNSIVIPAISGYTPPFGTKVIYNVSNKGGLSSRDVSNNILAAFGKTRPVVLSHSESTSSIEADTKIHINAEENITITLGDGTYVGCLVHILNYTELSHTLDCKFNSTNHSNFTILANESVELIWNGNGWQNINAPAVGRCIPQYPQEKTPVQLYPCTMWIEKDYNGAFFRTEGGNADAFIEEGNSIVVQTQETAVNHLSFSGTLNKNSDNEDSHPTFNLGKPSHTHKDTYTGYIRTGNGNAYQSYYYNAVQSKNVTLSLQASYVHIKGSVKDDSSKNHSHSFIPEGTVNSTDTETRPNNYAMKVWQRIA